MSFNAIKSSSAFRGDPSKNSGMFDSATRTISKNAGTLPGQPLLSYENLKPSIPLFFRYDGTSTQKMQDVPYIENIQSIGLAQVYIDGLVGGGSIVALHFLGSSADLSLGAKTTHNLTSVIPENSLFFFSDGSGSVQATFGGEPIVLWQSRSTANYKKLGLKVLDVATGASLPFNSVNLWLFALPINWQ